MSLVYLGHLGMVKTKGLQRTKACYPKFDKLIQKYFAKYIAFKAVTTKQH